MVILSHIQARPLIAARDAGQPSATVSLDLGVTTVAVQLGADAVLFPNRQCLSWHAIAMIAREKSSCFVVRDNAAEKVSLFSDTLNRAYSLLPTARAPTILNAGFTMHRIVGTDPYRDTIEKIRSIAPIHGRVLDTVTGLGYTAIEAAKYADHVLTIEIDPTVLAIARLNPWSRSLFTNPKITRVVGDTFAEIGTLDDRQFARIIHDPPSVSLAGELYSGEYYRQLHRVLQRGGRLFHYIGNLESGHGGKVAPGVMRRLQAAGFTRVIRCPKAFGLVAYK
ncbi:MAG: class I SAM-dependent methyltransferase [Thermomicrobiales bacterium]